MPEIKPVHADQRYITGLLQHDPKVIDEIYRNYSDQVRGWICRNSGTEDDAADIFQESLVMLYRQAEAQGLQLTCPFGAFLMLICRRMWLNELKKRQRKGVTISTDDLYNLGEDEQQQAAQLAEARERETLVRTHFGKLGDRCREIISASLTGKHQAELAAQLNVTYAYLRKKKSECMAQLIRMIRESGYQW